MTCTCKPQNYWRNDLIDQRQREGLAGLNGEVLCESCVEMIAVLTNEPRDDIECHCGQGDCVYCA